MVHVCTHLRSAKNNNRDVITEKCAPELAHEIIDSIVYYIYAEIDFY